MLMYQDACNFNKPHIDVRKCKVATDLDFPEAPSAIGDKIESLSLQDKMGNIDFIDYTLITRIESSGAVADYNESVNDKPAFIIKVGDAIWLTRVER